MAQVGVATAAIIGTTVCERRLVSRLVESDFDAWQDFGLHVAKPIAGLGPNDPRCGFTEESYDVQIAWNSDDSFVAEAVNSDTTIRVWVAPRRHRIMLDRGWLAAYLADGWLNFRRHADPADRAGVCRMSRRTSATGRRSRLMRISTPDARRLPLSRVPTSVQWSSRTGDGHERGRTSTTYVLAGEPG